MRLCPKTPKLMLTSAINNIIASVHHYAYEMTVPEVHRMIYSAVATIIRRRKQPFELSQRGMRLYHSECLNSTKGSES